MNGLLAVLFGIAFGFILQRTGALEYGNILKTLRLQDLKIAKFMFMAIAVSAVGVFSLTSIGYMSLDLIPYNLVGSLLGGLIFGIGFALTGYCPGTSIGAWAEGKKDAGYVMIGGMAGMLVYTLYQNQITVYLLPFQKGEMTLADLLPIDSVALAGIYSFLIGLTLYLIDTMEEKRFYEKGGTKGV